MPENVYKPEGQIIGTADNREYTSSAAGLEKAAAEGRILEGMAVICSSDMCLTVDLGGIRGIIPKHEAALPQENGQVKDIAVITRVGKAVCFKVLAVEKDENGCCYAVLSRRLAQVECMEQYLRRLKCGDVIPAKVTHLEHFGAFVDVGCGIVSLMSIDCISVSRISHPRDRFYVGMPIRAVVKSIDRETGRIYVTHKELLGTWEENAACFSAGQTVSGIVRSVEEYGIFVELTPNLAGLAEYKEDIIVGQTAAVYIKSIIPERMKIKLALIDSVMGEAPPRRVDYHEIYTETKPNAHIEYWRYSPECCPKIIETVFDDT